MFSIIYVAQGTSHFKHFNGQVSWKTLIGKLDHFIDVIIFSWAHKNKVYKRQQVFLTLDLKFWWKRQFYFLFFSAKRSVTNVQTP
jgi:hypothetical protein